MSIHHRKEIIVLVDAWSGGKYLIPAFQGLGYFCLHVQSGFVSAAFEADNQLAARRADCHIVHDGNVTTLLAALKTYRIRAVLPGSESGVSLADQINDVLGLPFSNVSARSFARRDKNAMQVRLAQAGLESIEQCLVDDVAGLDDWLVQRDQWPVVVKPVQSAGTDGVAICHTREQAHAALSAIIGKRDLFGKTNASALCQEFLEGEEYVVNGVACEGRYFLTELWHSRKRQHEGVPIYDVQCLRWPQDAAFSELTAYTIKVCEALGIRNGPFHAEVMLTSRGPVLIEIGARIAGGADPYIVEQCFGHSQISKAVQAIVHPAAFLQDMTSPADLSEHGHAAYVFMISPGVGVVRSTPEARLIAIDGVVAVNYRHACGDIQRRTRDLLSSPGLVIVQTRNAAHLERAVSEVRAAEADFYRTHLILQD